MEIVAGVIVGVVQLFVFLFFLVGIISLIAKPFFKEDKKLKKQVSDKKSMETIYVKKQEDTASLWDINKEQNLKKSQEKIKTQKKVVEFRKQQEIKERNENLAKLREQERKALQHIENERRENERRETEVKKQVELRKRNENLTKLREQEKKALQHIENERRETEAKKQAQIRRSNENAKKNREYEQRSILEHEKLIQSSINKLTQSQILSRTNLEEQKQLDFYEKNTWYSNEIQNTDGKFDSLRAISVGVINSISKQESDAAHGRLSNGIAILQEEIDLNMYIFSYGKMHKAKLLTSYSTCIHNHDFLTHKGKNIEIIDYGCGQGIGASLLIEQLYSKPCNNKISKVTLIEPSEIALKRAGLHVRQIAKNSNQDCEIYAISKLLDDITVKDLETNNNSIKFHIFSNILDVLDVSIELISQKLISSQRGINYFVCVSPNFFSDGTHKRNTRINNFMINLLNKFEGKVISERTSHIPNPSRPKPWARYEKVFSVNFDKPK